LQLQQHDAFGAIGGFAGNGEPEVVPERQA